MRRPAQACRPTVGTYRPDPFRAQSDPCRAQPDPFRAQPDPCRARGRVGSQTTADNGDRHGDAWTHVGNVSLRLWSCPNGVITPRRWCSSASCGRTTRASMHIVDRNATLPAPNAQAPTDRIRAKHAVGSVPKRPPITVIGTVTHEPTPKTSRYVRGHAPMG